MIKIVTSNEDFKIFVHEWEFYIPTIVKRFLDEYNQSSAKIVSDNDCDYYYVVNIEQPITVDKFTYWLVKHGWVDILKNVSVVAFPKEDTII